MPGGGRPGRVSSDLPGPAQAKGFEIFRFGAMEHPGQLDAECPAEDRHLGQSERAVTPLDVADQPHAQVDLMGEFALGPPEAASLGADIAGKNLFKIGHASQDNGLSVMNRQ